MVECQQLKKAVVLQKKELSCLLNISKMTSKASCLSLKEIINQVLLLIQQVFTDPKLICAQFVANDLKVKTKNFKITQYKLSQMISVKAKNDAKIEVFYLQPKATFYSKKEAYLIKLIAQIAEGAIKQKVFEAVQKKNIITNLKESQNLFVHHLHFDETVNALIKKTTMLPPEDIDQGINNMLQVLRNFLNIECCCLFLFNEDGLSARCAYKANMRGISPLKKELLAVDMPELFKLIKQGECLRVSDTNNFPKEFKLEKRVCQQQGIKSLMCMAITKEGKGIGFLCFESIKCTKNWIESDLISLLTLGKMLAYVLLEKELYSERKIHISKMESMAMEMLESLSLAIEKRDPDTSGHEKRTALLAVAIAKELGLSAAQIKTIYFGATIHDIGKIHVPAEILSYSGSLSPEQITLIKTHPRLGFDIIKNIQFLGPAREIVLKHHERLNGSGYPDGLMAKDIPIECRIVSVADVVEAMTSHRPYRPALGLDKALKEILANKNKLYDANVVDACVRLFKQKKFTFKDVPFICKG